MEETSEALVENTNQTDATPVNSEPAPAPAETTDDSGLLGQNSETDAGSGEDKTSEEPANEASDGGVLGAPENYVFEQFPEGTDASIITPLVNTARDLNLSQDATQKLLTAGLEGLQAKAQEQRTQLRAEALKDESLGFVNGASPNISKAFGTYFADKPELLGKLRAANLDVDRSFLSALAQIGRDISDGQTAVAGARTPQSDPHDFRNLFPNTKMNR